MTSASDRLSEDQRDPLVVTRFAPSPTGFLHIGGARTALFNWLYARHRGGKFLLRIEDTDRARSTQEAIEAIHGGLAWLGLTPDEPALYQSERAQRHREVADLLLAQGHAYKCFATPEELEAMREAARSAGKPAVYDRRWRDRDAGEASPGAPYVVRLKAPLEHATLLQDEVQGTVQFSPEALDDFVLLRSDGSPTYMLAVVVDDHDMGITHIIRGDDHLINAARQSLIFQALGWAVPVFAHIPLIHGSDGAKLSKRHGALGVEAYRDKGYVPEGMRNYLARLGWSHADAELFSTQEAIGWFDLGGINKAPARLDLDKLDFVNAHHLRKMPPETLVQETLARMRAGLALPEERSGAVEQRVGAVLDGLLERSKTLVELAEKSAFLGVERPIEPTGKAAKALNPQTLGALDLLRQELSQLSAWTMELLQSAISGICEQTGLKMGKVGPALRATLTGGAGALSVAEILLALGKDESLARLEDQTRRLSET